MTNTILPAFGGCNGIKPKETVIERISEAEKKVL
jgi:hypothetical protein